MSDQAMKVDRVLDLAEAVYSNDASESDFAELDSLLHADRELRIQYVDYCWMHASLRLQLRASRAAQKVRDQIDSESHLPVLIDSAAATAPTGSAMPFGFPSTIRTTLGYFSEGMPLAYLLAMVILGVGLLIGSRIYVSGPEQVAGQLSRAMKDRATHDPQMAFVGRITGMVDCEWADPKTEAFNGASVPLGRKYALASGLMEITYDTGAKVILQGPVTYEVESKDGGYLSVGKLMARVESRESRVQSDQSDQTTAKSQVADHPRLFSVRTPTATVTDLGTEFGVEVDERGITTSHVFRGAVTVLSLTGRDEPEQGEQVLLRENESIRVGGRGDDRKIVVGSLAEPFDFVRELPKRTITVLDLVDVVAGGTGFSSQRNSGINPTTGAVATSLRCAGPAPMVGDGQYHRILSMPFVDGVFIPDGRVGPVQVDSVGHVFDGFAATANMAWNPIWAGGALETPTKLGDVDYALPPHGLLFLASNNAITFDLETIRLANQGLKLVRFRAVVANTVTPGFEGCDFADIRVLVDGQSRFHRQQIRREHGVFSVLVPIRDNERFLTLATTDGGDGISGDWVTYGDPRLELLSVKVAPAPPSQEKDAG